VCGGAFLGACGIVGLRVVSIEPPHPERVFPLDSPMPQKTRPLPADDLVVWVGTDDGRDVPCVLEVRRANGSLVGRSTVGSCSVSGQAERDEEWTIDAKTTAPPGTKAAALLGFDYVFLPPPFRHSLFGFAGLFAVGLLVLVTAALSGSTGRSEG
jgi:hypothetical protein